MASWTSPKRLDARPSTLSTRSAVSDRFLSSRTGITFCTVVFALKSEVRIGLAGVVDAPSLNASSATPPTTIHFSNSVSPLESMRSRKPSIEAALNVRPPVVMPGDDHFPLLGDFTPTSNSRGGKDDFLDDGAALQGRSRNTCGRHCTLRFHVSA
ncbi:hypothetical protein BDZ89DRAFT_1135717 [Hymenopellis radicata]|nr:hypothetical protein BDZ89DRAFT_1135717 [Hymenopellis radicata]